MPMLIMPNCHDTSRLVSESMDRKLPLLKRILVRVHLRMCKYCQRFEQQLLKMQAIGRHLHDHFEPLDPSIALSDEARERIREALHAHHSSP